MVPVAARVRLPLGFATPRDVDLVAPPYFYPLWCPQAMPDYRSVFAVVQGWWGNGLYQGQRRYDRAAIYTYTLYPIP